MITIMKVMLKIKIIMKKNIEKIKNKNKYNNNE